MAGAHRVTAVVALLAVLAVVKASTLSPPAAGSDEVVDWDKIADEMGVPVHLRNLASDLELDSIVDVHDLDKEEADKLRSHLQSKNKASFRQKVSFDADTMTDRMNREVIAREALARHTESAVKEAAKSTGLGTAFLQVGEGDIVDTDPRPECQWRQHRTGDCDNPNVRNQYVVGESQFVYYMRIHVVQKSGQSSWINELREEINKEVYIKNIGLMVTDANNDLAQAGIYIKAQIYYWTSTTFEAYSIGDQNSGKCINFASYQYNLKKFGAQYFGSETSHTIVDNFCGSSNANVNGFAYYPWTGYSGWIAMKFDAVNAATGTYAHEVGHSLGLYHTFVGVSAGSGGEDALPVCSECYEASPSAYRGDMCEDTPPHAVGKDVWGQLAGTFCNQPGAAHCNKCSGLKKCEVNGKFEDGASGKNMMSYSTSWCRGNFTTCQRKRMLCWGQHGRVNGAFRKQCYKLTEQNKPCCKKMVDGFVCEGYGTCKSSVMGSGFDC